MSSTAPACPVCGSRTTRPWFHKHGYEHCYCGQCGFGFVHPSPSREQLDLYYAELAEGLSSDCSWETEPRHKIQLWRQLLSDAVESTGTGPLLDLGCGAGQFLRVAIASGWPDVTGVELSDKAVELAQAVEGATVLQGSWRDVPLETGHYVAVALLDMLEHAADARALLQRVSAVLRPGGTLMLTVPNLRGLSIRCLGRHAYVVIPPEHVSYFSAHSLAMLLRDTGFEDIRHHSCDIYLKEWLRFIPKGRPSVGSESKDAVMRHRYARYYDGITSKAGLAGIGAANRLLAMLGVGDQLVCVARKPR